MNGKTGQVIERGKLPDGTEYRVWLSPGRKGEQRKYVYVGDAKDGKGKRHRMPWLKKQLASIASNTESEK